MSFLGVVYLFDTLKTVGDIAVIHHCPSDAGARVVQATSGGSGNVRATILVEGSNIQDSTAWCTIGTIQLYGTGSVSNFKDSTTPWKFTRVSLIENVNGQTIACNISA